VGTALTEGYFGHYGGVVYAYNQTHTLLWIPSKNAVPLYQGYMAYVGGVWTRSGDTEIMSSRAKVINKIINLAGKYM
jgi:hypothetical protein